MIFLKISYSREKIGDGIYFSSIVNECQKTNSIFVQLVTKLSEDTAALNAVIPYVLSNSSDKYRTVTSLSRKLSELYGASLRGNTLKYGDSQVVLVASSCINDCYTLEGEKITGETAAVLMDCVTDPYIENGGFYESDFNLKKQELIDDIDAEINEKRSYAIRRAGETVYKGEPAAISAKGSKSRAESITAVSAYEQYLNLLKTAGIEITFVGADAPDESIIKIIKDGFAHVKREYAGDNGSALSPVKSEPVRVQDRLDVVQSKMVMAFKSDCRNTEAMKLMSAVFGGTPFSKLFLNVREKLSLCYYCASGYNERKGVLTVDSGVENENIEKAEKEILNQLENVKNGDFTDSEVNEARLAVINGLRGVNDSARSIADWYFKQNYSGSSDSPEDEIEKMYKVKREDIIEAAKSLTLDTVYVLTGKESAEVE